MTFIDPKTVMIGTSLIATGLAARAAELPAKLQGYDPSGHIRLATLEEAETRRENVILPAMEESGSFRD